MKKILSLVCAAVMLSLLALPQKAMAVTTSITAIYGSGNPDADWDTFTGGGTTIGLRAKITATGATPDDGNGLYTIAPGTLWQIEPSFHSGTANLNAYGYSWTVSGPSIAGGSVTFDPSTFYASDNSFGILGTTLNGQGVEGTFAALGGSNNLMQLSQKITFSPFFGSFATEGLYTLSASMTNLQTQQVVNSGSIQIQVGQAQGVPDGGKTIGLLAIGLVGMGLISLRTKRDTPSALMSAT